MADILVLHGPNLNRLGTREPEQYGATPLDEIDRRLKQQAQGAGHAVETFQSNAEHALIDRVHAASDAGAAWIICNPAALTHTSVALRDALLAAALPFIEVHLSNVHARESFRQRSLLSDVATGVITGLGPQGYELALSVVLRRLEA